MKLHRLELEGFGPFRHRQVVDFDAFDDDGIFLISGRTGAGKSSILDGVCFALYGMVPRYEGAGKRLRSDHCAPDEPTQVVLEFSAHGQRYRVVRSPEYDRPKARGEGMTPEKARVEVSVRDGEGWRGLTTHAKEAGTLIAEEIVGLTGAQFLQVILLAQNKFADFLLAGNDERQALLRNLFGSRTYVDYEAALEQRRRDSQRSADKRGDELDFLLTEAERVVAENALGAAEASEDDSQGSDAPPADRDPAHRLIALERSILRARYAADAADFARERADEVRVAAQGAHAEQVAVREAQLKRVRAREALAVLEESAGEVALVRVELAEALAAESLRAPLDAAETASAACEVRTTRVEQREREWQNAGGDAHSEVSELAEVIDALTGDIRIWEEALEHEHALHTLDADMSEVDARVSRAQSQIDAAVSRRDEARQKVPELERDYAEVQERAAQADVLAERVQSLSAQRDAAARVRDLTGESLTADQRHADAVAAHALAVAAVGTLLRRRLTGAAADLAADLVEGEPCAVCGSHEHPHPATRTDDEAVTDDDVDRAQRAADAAGSAATAAEKAARDLHSKLADARARANDMGGEELDDLLATARAARDAAGEAVVRAQAIRQEQEAARQRIDESERQIADATAVAAAAKEERAALSARADAARAAVVAARGEFATVSERVADVSAHRERARALRDARSDLAVAREALAVAEADLVARLKESTFSDAGAARTALRTASQRDAFDARVREYDADLAGRRETLRQLEIDLAGAPEDLVDIDASREAAAVADGAHAAAAATATTARSVATRLADVHARATSAHERTAAAAAEHRVIVGLADAVAGRNVKKMDLETFVLAAELEQIVIAAARRLEEMSSGRYRLRHTDALAARNRASGLGLEVVDAHTGKARSPQSLSGGETFLASLALALGLAEVVTARAGGVTLDTLFIDEGFGSLDAETLEMAMSTLDELRQGGRTVGIISHVAAMKERIPARVEVRASAQGASTIAQAAVSHP
ncbi:AAA family ATPase [Microbacterium sp. C7(2022)]|uniref:AAA family ATPase n=1 Tax=Microbacterium sp. C7(2022) TaxID=2992759 RepID=UPI00237C3CE8|nr:AAA family ATPase [Microbacterium sp. C7(2022)]MDE0546196.1 AAA family ATPase [Microbacterium sp. C7(2022)]